MEHPEFAGLTPYVPDSSSEMMDSKDHGSCVTALATGITCGVAKKAHLVPIKYKNSKFQATNAAIIAGIRFMTDRVKQTNKGQSGPVPPPGMSGSHQSCAMITKERDT